MPLHASAPVDRPSAITVCDVALDNTAAVTQLRGALSRHHRRGAPLLCLVREKSHHLMTQAKAIGATDILEANAPREALCARLLALIGLGDGGDPAAAERRALAQDGVLRTGLVLSRLFDVATLGLAVEPDILEQGSHAVLDAVRQTDIRSWLDVVWQHDDATYQHCLLVAGLAAAFAQRLGFREKDQHLLSQAALLHDIGKAWIPPAILNKPGKLTAEEMQVMRTHATIGHQLLVRQGKLDRRLLDVVRHHHEYLDGSGYPDGLRDPQIGDLVRLTTICDIYAALIEQRPYKPALPPQKAFEIMVEMGGKLDQDLLAAFRRVAEAAGSAPADP
ncbi:MAG TPA: HD-GYP domain-containing protein [Roseomonas sp.]